MALNAGNAREMCAKAEAVGVKHMINFTSRWYPNTGSFNQPITPR